MLSDSQIKKAKSLVFEYTQNNLYIDAIENRLNTPNLKPESREQWQKELTDLKQRQKEIEEIYKKEFSVDLQKLEDRTALGIMSNIPQQQERESVPVPQRDTAGDRLLEKTIPYHANPYHPTPERLEAQKKEIAEQKTPEKEPEQLTEQTFSVTHPERKLTVAERYQQGTERYHERQQRLTREHNFDKDSREI